MTIKKYLEQILLWAMLPIAIFYKFGFSILFAVLLPAAVVTLPLVVSDIKTKLLPNRLLYPAICSTILVITIFSVTQHSLSKFAQPILRAFIISGCAFILYLASRGTRSIGCRRRWGVLMPFCCILQE